MNGCIDLLSVFRWCQDGGHSGEVNCVQWHPQDALLYSGSEDTQIVEWDLQTGKSRWSVSTFCSFYNNMHPLSRSLLMPGMEMILFLRKYLASSSCVFRMPCIPKAISKQCIHAHSLTIVQCTYKFGS